MDIQKLAEQLAGLRFQSGHAFDNGTPFYETLSKESAEGLLRALQSKGYVLGRENFASPSIAPDMSVLVDRPPQAPDALDGSENGSNRPRGPQLSNLRYSARIPGKPKPSMF